MQLRRRLFVSCLDSQCCRASQFPPFRYRLSFPGKTVASDLVSAFHFRVDSVFFRLLSLALYFTPCRLLPYTRITREVLCVSVFQLEHRPVFVLEDRFFHVKDVRRRKLGKDNAPGARRGDLLGPRLVGVPHLKRYSGFAIAHQTSVEEDPTVTCSEHLLDGHAV